MKIKKKANGRGFKIYEFNDRYDIECSIQMSSLATESAIWFGVDNANPQIMASQANQLGIETDKKSGWIDYPIPSQVLLTTRMHLTQKQVAALLPILQKFTESGKLP